MIGIIGAGPAGSWTAFQLAKKGKEVSVFEEHKEIGSPVQCTGIVTSSINNHVNLKKNIILNKIKKARIYSQKNFVELNLKNPNLIIDRKAFDSQLAKMAEKAGAKFYLNHKYIGNTKQKLITDKKTIDYTHLIGADGPLSGVAKINNMFGKREFWTGFQARVKMKNDNAVEFYPNIGTYAWIVPENKDFVRIGVVGEKNTKQIFEKFISSKIQNKNHIIEYQGGIIPKYNPKQITQKNNIYLVGDAAGQVKATTGGGIIQSLSSAKALSDSICLDKDYSKLWKGKVGKDLWLHLKMRNIMDKFSEKDWQKLISIFKKQKNKRILQEFDRDYPTRFMLKLLISEPKLLLFARHII